jgi:Tol biopolymer transport system component
MNPEPHALESGLQILHYRLAEKIGEGGMGQVWKATDSTLDRTVAIKVLPPAFAADPDRLARFEREARLLASLNHPNIATIFSVHVVDGVRYLSMEFVPGEDLAQRLARGPVPIPDAIEIARQIALALEAAHESGVVHRDLKPANVRITPDGRVKVLDFGLAKAMEASAASTPALSQSPTFAGTALSGMIVGTAAYMSPEQARGQSVDRRTDIWAFGVVLYEMLTGQRAFTGETVSDILAAVLRAEPDRSALPKDLPPAIRSLLERCLEKNPRRRLRDIGEALIVLEDVQAGRAPATAAETAAPGTGSRFGRVARVAGVIALAFFAMLAIVAFALRSKPHEQTLRKFTLALKDEGEEVTNPAVSPNGKQIAYLQGGKLWIRDLAQLSSRPLADGPDVDFSPLWSRDGSFIVFANSTGLSRVDVAGGAVSPICAIPDFVGGSGATWATDGSLLFTIGHDHIYRVAAGGGVPTVYIARIDSLESDLHHPFELPGGRAILCVRHLLPTGPNTLALIEKGKRKDLLAIPTGVIWSPVYDPRGFILFSRIGDGAGLWALPFSLERLSVTGEPFLIATDGASPSVASDGTMTYNVGTSTVESRAVIIDRTGAIHDTLTEPKIGNWSLALSPDERQLAVEIRSSGEGDIWLYDLERKSETRFAFGPLRQGEAAWSPDGREIAFQEAGARAAVTKPADGSQAPRLLIHGTLARVTPDGQHVVYCKNGVNGSSDIWYASIGGADSMAVVAGPGIETWPMPSPDGRYLLYNSDESGKFEVYLRQFPRGEGRWQVSTNGGGRPLWSRKGDHIYYTGGDLFYEVPVDLASSVRLGTPHVLFDLSKLKMQTFGRYSVVPTSNPDRFVALKSSERSSRSHTDAIVVENWTAEFAKRK